MMLMDIQNKTYVVLKDVSQRMRGVVIKRKRARINQNNKSPHHKQSVINHAYHLTNNQSRTKHQHLTESQITSHTNPEARTTHP